MSGSTIWRVALGVVLAVVLIGVGVQVYEVGVAQGLAQGTQVATTTARPDVAQPGVVQPGVAPSPYYGYGHWMRPWGFGAFGFLHLLFPILLFFLIFALFRAAWGARHGWGGYRYDWGRVPTDFDDWHRRAHEGQTASTGQGGSTAT
jgi:hypothetical protein